MKKLLGAVAAIAIVAAGFLGAVLIPRSASRHKNASAEETAPSPARHSEPKPEAPPIAIPETVITLKRAIQGTDSAGAPTPNLEAGAQLIAESTQGLDYIVSRDGLTFHVHCDDAFETHGRFTDGRAEQFALQLAAEIRAEGKVPTNERIASRAQDALEQRRVPASLGDAASLVESLQKVMLLHPSADLDSEPPSPPVAKPE